MDVHHLTSLLSHLDLYIIPPSEIGDKDFIWNYPKSQERVVFAKVFSGFPPFSRKPHKEK